VRYTGFFLKEEKLLTHKVHIKWFIVVLSSFHVDLLVNCAEVFLFSDYL
jgi:hypothetical protein